MIIKDELDWFLFLRDLVFRGRGGFINLCFTMGYRGWDSSRFRFVGGFWVGGGWLGMIFLEEVIFVWSFEREVDIY